MVYVIIAYAFWTSVLINWEPPWKKKILFRLCEGKAPFWLCSAEEVGRGYMCNTTELSLHVFTMGHFPFQVLVLLA